MRPMVCLKLMWWSDKLKPIGARISVGSRLCKEGTGTLLGDFKRQLRTGTNICIVNKEENESAKPSRAAAERDKAAPPEVPPENTLSLYTDGSAGAGGAGWGVASNPMWTVIIDPNTRRT